MAEAQTARVLLLSDAGCNKPENPLSSGRIMAAFSDGSKMKPIITKQSLPETAAVFHEEQRIFWTAMGFPGKPDGALWTSNLDGCDAEAIIPPGGDLNTPKQMILDPIRRKIYICDREGLKLVSCELDGSCVETLVTTGDPDNPEHKFDATRWCVGVAADWEHGKIYWSQKGAPKSAQGRILRASLDMPGGCTASTRRDIECLMEKLPEPVDLEFDATTQSLYWTDRGDVPHGNSLNRCRVGILHQDRPLTCHPLEPTRYEVLARNLHDPIGLKLDLQRQCIYVADMGGTVYQFDLDGGNKRRIYSDDEACYTGITIV